MIELLEHADAAPRAAGGFADGLDVEVERHGRVDVGQRPRLAVDDVVADAHAVAPERVLVAEPDHVEVVERRQRDAQLLAAGAPQRDLGAARVPRAGLVLDGDSRPPRRARRRRRPGAIMPASCQRVPSASSLTSKWVQRSSKLTGDQSQKNWVGVGGASASRSPTGRMPQERSREPQ